MSKFVLITGASCGIGYELSKVFAKNGYSLVLVSRTKDKLEAVSRELIDEHHIQAKVKVKDLSKPDASFELYDEVIADGIETDVLVNNAGFGLNGAFVDLSENLQLELLQLNITSLTLLCKLFGSDMAKKRSGRILNVASTAAFQAGPLMSTYFASKAYVLSFSEGISNELARNGVDVSVLCPGPTQTEFGDRARISEKKIANVPWLMNATEVAEIGYAGLMNRKKVIIPGAVNKLLAFSSRLMPRPLLTHTTRFLNN